MLTFPVRCGRRGVAAMEFAFVAPIMLLLIIGVFDIAKAMILRQEVYNTAHSVSLSASFVAVQSNGSTTLTQAQVQTIESDIFAEIPWLRNGIEKGITSVTLSGIEFSALPTASCNPYTTCSLWFPFVAWSVPYRPTSTYGVTFVFPTRTCGVMTSGVVSITAVPPPPLTVANQLTTLRTGGITYPDPILVADVRYSYTPAFFRFITGTIDFVVSAYWPVRVIPYNSNTSPGGQIGTQQLTTYDLAGTDAHTGAHCAGYP